MDDRNDADGAAAMDPVALTLAVWLGLIVGVMGMVRLSENAAQQAAGAHLAIGQPGYSEGTAEPTDDPGPFSVRLMAFGG